MLVMDNSVSYTGTVDSLSCWLWLLSSHTTQPRLCYAGASTLPRQM